MKKKLDYNHYINNGYCVLNLLSKQDVEDIKKLVMAKLNTIANKKIFSLKNDQLEKYDKLVSDNKLHNKLMNPDKRYIKLPKKIIRKIFNVKVSNILKKQWGHNKYKLYWIGDTSKKNKIRLNSFGKHVSVPISSQIKINSSGFRIVRPNYLKMGDDAAGAHLDVNYGGEIRNDFLALVTIWVPLTGFSSKYTLNVYPKTHKISHSKNLKQKGGKITPIFSKKYERNFKKARSNMKKGQVIMFHPNLIHGTCINKGIISRASLDFRIINLKRVPVPAS